MKLSIESLSADKAMRKTWLCLHGVLYSSERKVPSFVFVCQHFHTISPMKILGQLLPNFI